MKKLLTLVLSAVLTSCTAMYFPVSSNGYSRNSIYYTSIDEVTSSVSDTLTYDDESYAAKIRKFDSPTYTIELNLNTWYPDYYWRWNRWTIYPYTAVYWNWTWPWDYYRYWGYYNPYRYHSYYYWDWHRPYYTYYKPHRPYYTPKHNPRHDVRYTRRGGVTPARPAPKGNPRGTTTYRRSSNSPRQATASRKTNVRYNSGNQSQRTGYGRSTTSTQRRSDTYTRPQPRSSERYTPQRSNTGYTGNSNRSGSSHSQGSSTRRK